MTTRRGFLKNTAITTAGLGLVPAFSGALAGSASVLKIPGVGMSI
jgi:hypothetical protein